MLVPGWVRGETQPKEANVTLETYVDHIDRVCQLAGNAQHAAIGTDLDGGFGTGADRRATSTPSPTCSACPTCSASAATRTPTSKGIMHGNWVRFFRTAWKK